MLPETAQQDFRGPWPSAVYVGGSLICSRSCSSCSPCYSCCSVAAINTFIGNIDILCQYHEAASIKNITLIAPQDNPNVTLLEP